MSDDLLIPISDEQAKAIQEVAKLGTSVVEAAQKSGGYVTGILGNVPRDFVGLMLGDRLAHARLRNFAKLQDETLKELKDRGLSPPYEEVSPSLAIPLITAAVDDTREGLQELWSKLLASAMDPARKGKVRNLYIEILKKLEPLDAAVLAHLAVDSEYRPSLADHLVAVCHVPHDDIEVSIQNLADIGLVQAQATSLYKRPLSATGRAFLRVVS